MNAVELKEKAIAAIEARKDELIEMGEYLFRHAESGYHEANTSAYMKRFLENEGLSVKDGIAITGLKSVAKGREHNANVAMCAELDSLIMPNQKYADPVTGCAHACGHHAQLVNLAGVVMGLISTGIYQELGGDLTFLVVPAEEIIELDYRKELIKQGKISYVGGKQNFITLGEIDDIDCILGCHAGINPEPHFDYGIHYNGLIAKNIYFHGKSAHGAKSPDMAINALHAAVNAINNINSLRERFRDQDHIRVHYIITKGGDSVNIIPDDVRMEMCVRGYSAEAMSAANKLVNEAIRAGAMTIGATVDIEDVGAYLPMNQSAGMGKVFHENAVASVGEENVIDYLASDAASSTDAGDFSAMKPALQPYMGGASGVLHTDYWDVVDPYRMYVESPKVFACTLIDLLYGKAEKAREIADNYKPLFKNKEEYDAFFKDMLGH